MERMNWCILHWIILSIAEEEVREFTEPKDMKFRKWSQVSSVNGTYKCFYIVKWIKSLAFITMCDSPVLYPRLNLN